MREIIRQRDVVGVSSLYVTQNLDEVRYLCSHYYDNTAGGEAALHKEDDDFCLTNTRILLLNEGKIIFDRQDEFFWNASGRAHPALRAVKLRTEARRQWLTSLNPRSSINLPPHFH
jgi:hypothetical protein